MLNLKSIDWIKVCVFLAGCVIIFLMMRWLTGCAAGPNHHDIGPIQFGGGLR